MKFGKLNLVAGAIIMLLAGAGGMLLGATFDTNSVKDGYHILSLVRFYLREGHSHSMPFGLYNLIFAFIVDRLALSDLHKRIASITAIAAVLLPLGLLGKGMAGAAPDFPPFGMLGIFAFLASIVYILIGSRKLDA